MTSMTNHPNNQSSAVAMPTATRGGGAGHDCRSRDIKRRLEVIQKKMSDLQELGVPCGFCYVSVRNSSTLFTMGHPAITQPIEKSRDLILQHLSETQCVTGAPSGGEISSTDVTRKEIHMLLPPLPAPMEELSLPDLRSLVVGIVKDLGLKWSDQKPSFWPEDVPFQYPRAAPDGYQGCWTKGLRQVLQSIYSYFNYDPSTHCWATNRPTVSSTDHAPSSHHLNSSSSSTSSSSRTISSTSSLSPAPDHLPLTSFPVFNGLPMTVPVQMEEQDEEEDVDVGTPEDVTSRVGVVPPPPVEDDLSDVETISVCSDGDEVGGADRTVTAHAVSYFGYELAQSESSHSSPQPGHASSEHDESSDAPLPFLPVATETKGLSLIQPHLLYCSSIYSHMYPALQLPSAATPLLLPPGVLMKQLYAPPPKSTKDESPPTSVLVRADSGACPKEPHSFLFPTSSTSPHATHRSNSPLSTITAPSHNDVPVRFKDRPHATPTSAHAPPETKNRKCKNGIYIYTNPTAPLQFMSLGSRKRPAPPTDKNGKHPSTHSSSTHAHASGVSAHSNRGEDQTARKLVAGAPVSPHTGEPVVMRDSTYHQGHAHHLRQVPTLTSNESDNDSSRTPPPSSRTPPPNSRRLQSSIKKKRELVFHWYKSPETPPIGKRPRLLDSV